MGSLALHAYRRLPAPLRSAAATVQGARLRWWRYGRGSEALVEAALERDRWSPAQWSDWQAERLAHVLARAAREVPAHRARWQDRTGDPRELADWPVLSKEDLRRDPFAFVAAGTPRRRYLDRTSGTSGTPLTTVASRRSLEAWFALHEARTRRWHDVSRHDPWALLGGQLVVPAARARPPFWVHNRALHQLYLSGQHVGAGTAAAYADAIGRHQPTHLVAYPSLAAVLGEALLEQDLVLDGPRLVVANAEPVTAGQRAVLGQAFGATVRETYGMAEMAGGASECEHGRLHWWSDGGLLEVLDDHDQPVAPGKVGRLVLTGLVADDQVLVRYDVGDRGRGLSGEVCPCGRSLPVLHPVEGRSQDLLVLPDGRRVFWVNPLFYDLPVLRAQVRQRSAAQVDVLVVPAPAWDASSEQVLRERAVERLGTSVEVRVEVVDAIAPGPGGKVRPVVSDLAEG
jgi:phenylacetate-CoA ligase